MTSDSTTARRLQTWEAHRARGKAHFVLVRGVLQWGVVTGILWAAAMAAMLDKDFFSLLPIALVLFPLGGILWGAAVWSLMERKRRKHAGAPRP